MFPEVIIRVKLFDLISQFLITINSSSKVLYYYYLKKGGDLLVVIGKFLSPIFFHLTKSCV